MSFKTEFNVSFMNHPISMAEQNDILLPKKVSFPETVKNTFDVIRYYGYPAEQYDITTEDGYIITIHRIPYGKSGPGDKPKQPVIVQHGFLCSSIIWVFNTPEDSLGFILADAGYDVWLTNIRGNNYGRKHTTLNPKKETFWKFSFDEMGRYDMPAIIDFVITKTGFSQINYIGHSLGTTVAFVMLASKPEYNDKIRCLIALGPVISVQHSTSTLVMLKRFKKHVRYLLKIVRKYEILPNSHLTKFFTKLACNSLYIRMIFLSMLFDLGGANSDQLDLTRLPVYSNHIPAGASVKTIIHGLQLTKPGFKRYDYGPSKNRKKYGQTIPPQYDMNNVTAPVAIFWSENDIIADPADVDILVSQLPNMVLKFKVPYRKFTHMDYFWSVEVKFLLYNKVLQVMSQE